MSYDETMIFLNYTGANNIETSYKNIYVLKRNNFNNIIILIYLYYPK